jgi:dethiobiotin synthetase
MSQSATPAGPKGFLVTGTDTGVGKTLVTAALMRRCRERGLAVAGMKPVATGCTATAFGPRSEDALILEREGSARWPYETVNPFAYLPPIAPHLAAEEAGRPVDFEELAAQFATLAAASDLVFVEGIGGWRVPLAGQATIAELAARLGLPVILVVALRLGCLNHTLLSAESIVCGGHCLAGWVANGVDPSFERRAGNVATLAASLPAPLLAEFPHFDPPDVRRAAALIDVQPLLA